MFLNIHPLNQPEVIVSFAQDKIYKDGRLTDENTKTKIRKLIYALIVWTGRLNRN